MTISKLYYQSIDLQQTGMRLKKMLESSGYTPKMIQEYLHLSCVQPIYRWYKGLILPSVDHLLMLSELLNVHMEEFLVKKSEISMLYDIPKQYSETSMRRCTIYYNRIHKYAA